MWEVRPILSALLRNKTRAVLIAFQIAFTLAIVSNALFIIAQRVEKMNRPTGLDVDNLIYLNSRDLRPDSDYFVNSDEDLAILRGLPGVVSAGYIGSAPLSGGGNGECFSVEDDPEATCVSHNRNKVDEHGLTTLGLNLIEGRDFTAQDMRLERRGDVGFSPLAIVTKALAEEWFPDESAVGKVVYSDGDAATIVGVVERMQGPWLNSTQVERVMLQPIVREVDYNRYMVLAEPGERDRLIPEIEEALRASNPDRIINVRSQREILDRTYGDDRSMTQMLLGVIALLVAVSTIGIFGLANSSVTQRTKQIGTRRALGARKVDVVRYFMVENGLVTGFGVVLGAVLAVVFNAWLVHSFELPRIDWRYVGVGFVILLVLGQIAVLLPARRATRIEPSIATRTV